MADNATQVGFLTLGELKGFLNTTRGSAVDDDQLIDCGAAACSVVEGIVGPVTTTTITDELVDASNGYFSTRYRIASLTAPQDGWAVASDYGVTGVSTRGALRVSYTTGYAAPPAWAKMAAKIIARHLWRTQLGPQNRDDTPAAGSGYLIPNQAMALLEPYALAVGLA